MSFSVCQLLTYLISCNTEIRCGDLCYRPRYQYTVRPGYLLIFMYTDEIEIIKLNDVAFQSFDFECTW